jgi:septum formation protein|tara:strand:+ start:665 stop:1243 length:579 start_codon:yes stop_codon:yes gene_type:complete
MRKIILASSSKHRKKLLNQLKIKFTTKSPDIDESRRKNENVDEFVRRLSYEKALKVAKNERDSIVIGSDEIAVLGNKVYGKPLTKSVAIQQLQAISNKNIIFKTGLCVIDTSAHKKYLSLTNYNVKMRKLSIDEIHAYINKEDILNCAASIKIEGLAISLIEKTSGSDPTSIIGLPLIKLRNYLDRLGVNIP